ncbi:MAG TPA: hypothetical protein IAA98_02565 [Candidatus Avipropionibacterium avicola]|uniref:Uncharacterized protein n=1 Tax=Candidatus Avipropionibacterium avicola TaxID=2840701 RepID=A0A9D1KMN5_9ACTN|nr:hypothetical protein [Candidatus Avipropionibacterium avicola]
MSAPTSIDLKQRLAPLRMMVMAMAGTMVVLGVIAQVILPEVELDATQLVIAVGLGLVGGVVALLTAGTFIRPLDQDEPNPLVAGLMRLQSATFVQMALADGSALVLFALGFVLPINAMAVLIGLLLAAAMTVLIAWPGRSRLRKARQLLERNGARCPLDEQDI